MGNCYTAIQRESAVITLTFKLRKRPKTGCCSYFKFDMAKSLKTGHIWTASLFCNIKGGVMNTLLSLNSITALCL